MNNRNICFTVYILQLYIPIVVTTPMLYIGDIYALCGLVLLLLVLVVLVLDDLREE